MYFATQNFLRSEVAQIQFYMHFLRKSIRLSPLIKVFHLMSDLNETCTKCKSTVEVSFPKVLSKLAERWRIFINGKSRVDFMRKIRSSWIWATSDFHINQEWFLMSNTETLCLSKLSLWCNVYQLWFAYFFRKSFT